MRFEDVPIGTRWCFTDDFLRDALVVTERREGEFDMLGQTWICVGAVIQGKFTGSTSRVYERIS